MYGLELRPNFYELYGFCVNEKRYLVKPANCARILNTYRRVRTFPKGSSSGERRPVRQDFVGAVLRLLSTSITELRTDINNSNGHVGLS